MSRQFEADGHALTTKTILLNYENLWNCEAKIGDNLTVRYEWSVMSVFRPGMLFIYKMKNIIMI